MICSAADAQSLAERLRQRAKEVAERKLEEKVENAVSDVMDGKMGKKKKDKDKVKEEQKGKVQEAEAPVEEVNAENKKTESKPVQINNAKDFVRGAIVLFQDNFESDPIGEFPAHWDIVYGNADVVEIDGIKAVRLTQGGSIFPYIEPGTKNFLPEEFTLEYKFLISKQVDINGLRFREENDDDLIYCHYTKYDISHIGKINSNISFPSELSDGWHQVQLSYNKGAYKLYIDGQRYINSPREKQPHYFTLDVIDFESSFYTDIILCKGAKEKHEQQATDLSEVERAMLESGKFVTNNILFETGKATLKPESMTEIQNVADYMKKNPSVRFEVQGHTDNQGSDKINDPLSQQRAEAVVKALADLGVDEWNLRAVGKGSHEPVADNKTEEGRAKNRRVEFIKK